ncbi:MAG: BBP7 family outer membrane beta-barrel protein [Planctomycetota bacterium]
MRPAVPSPAPHRFTRRRLAAACVGLAIVSTLSHDACAQADDWSPARPSLNERTSGPRAILIRNAEADPGAPPYALVDQYGRVQRYVEPTPGVDLEAHVGQQVRVAHDTGMTLLASQLDLPDELRPLAAPSDRPARFVPPRRLTRLERSRRDPLRRVQFSTDDFSPTMNEGPTTDRLPTEAEPIDLDAVIADQAEATDRLPAPQDSRLEPIVSEPLSGGYVGQAYDGEVVHAEDCPHCNKRYRAKIVDKSPPASGSCDCDQCQKTRTAAGSFNRCRNQAWCGPTCNPPSRRGFYGRAEYLLWWFDDMDTPPLATQNTAPARPDFDTPGTTTIYGGEILDDARNGLRFTAGMWLDNERDFAIEGDVLFFETETEIFSAGDAAGGGTISIGRPFYDIAPVIGGVPTQPQENVQLITLPGTVGGVMGIVSRSEFESAGLRLRTGICCREIGGCQTGCGPCGALQGATRGRPSAISRIDFIGGYRYASLDESIAFNESVTLLSSAQSLTLNESFATDNDFHGVDLGFIYEWESRRWAIELVSKIALGVTDQEVRINGATTSEGVTTAGGLLAQSTNIGSYNRDRFSVLPELSARLAYRVTPRLRASVGYSLLYWSSVVRPGDQIDYTVDSRVISPPVGDPESFRHPHFAFDDTAVWAHGFNFGLDYNY